MILTPATLTFASGMDPSKLPDWAIGSLAKGDHTWPITPISHECKATTQIVREDLATKAAIAQAFKGKMHPRRDGGTRKQLISSGTDTAQN
jgi:hypothetical protein